MAFRYDCRLSLSCSSELHSNELASCLDGNVEGVDCGCGYWQRGIATQQIPSASDMPIKLENPYKEPPKKCILCGISVDYKNIQLLSQFISPYTGRILSRRITGLCGKKQKEISKTIKKSQRMGFMSVTLKDPAFIKDTNICDYKLWE